MNFQAIFLITVQISFFFTPKPRLSFGGFLGDSSLFWFFYSMLFTNCLPHPTLATTYLTRVALPSTLWALSSRRGD